MTTSNSFMTDDHRQCDDLLAEAEMAQGKGDLAAARSAFAQFRAAMLEHFDVEEKILFPRFEAKTGMTQGPTAVMRGEHEQMRDLLDAALAALAEPDGGDYSGLVETLIILMQQHNMKEENILYPMCDQHLADESAALVDQLAGQLAGERKQA